MADLEGDVEAGWYTKAQINGEGGGFGLSVKLNADGTVLSSFVVDTDVFAVMSRAGGVTTKRHPFIIKNGTVYMNHAMMDTAEIGNVIAKYINVQHLKGSLIEGGSFRGGDLWLGENATGQFGDADFNTVWYTEASKRNPLDLFRASVQSWPEVVECVALTGEMDYLLRVVVADMAHYSRFIMDTLLKHPSVQDCKTSFVLDRVKSTTALPL